MGVLSLLWTNAATVVPWQEVSRVQADAGADRVIRSAASIPGRPVRREPPANRPPVAGGSAVKAVDSGAARQGRLRRANICSGRDIGRWSPWRARRVTA